MHLEPGMQDGPRSKSSESETIDRLDLVVRKKETKARQMTKPEVLSGARSPLSRSLSFVVCFLALASISLSLSISSSISSISRLYYYYYYSLDIALARDMFRGGSAMELELHDIEQPPPPSLTRDGASTSAPPSSTTTSLSSSSSSSTTTTPAMTGPTTTTTLYTISSSLPSSGIALNAASSSTTSSTSSSSLASRLAQPTQRLSAMSRSDSGNRLSILSSAMSTLRKPTERMLRSDSSDVLCSSVVLSAVDDYDDDDDDGNLILPSGSSTLVSGGGGSGNNASAASGVAASSSVTSASAAAGLGSASSSASSAASSSSSSSSSGDSARLARRSCFTGRTRTTIIATLLFIVIIGFATFKLPVNEWSRDFLQLIPRLGFWGPLVFIVSYALFTVLFLPILPLTLASGVLFGVWFGTIYSWIGAVFGGCVAFILGKQVFAKCALEMAESFPHFAAIDRAISGNSWKIVLFLRLSPLIPFNVMSYILSLTQIGFLSYTGATAAGVLIPTSACVWVGAAATSIADILANPTRGSVGLLIGGTVLSIISLAIITQSSTRAIQYELRKIRDSELPISINDTEPLSPDRFTTTRVV